MIKDKLKLDNDLKPLDIKCQSCGKFSHLILDCNHLQYKSNLDKLIHGHNKQTPQDRSEFTFRRKSRSQNAVQGVYKLSAFIQLLQLQSGISQSQDVGRDDMSSSGQLNKEYQEGDSFLEEREKAELQSQASSKALKRKSIVAEKDGTYLGGKIRNNKLKRPTLKIMELPKIIEENKNLEEKSVVERLTANTKRISLDYGLVAPLNDLTLTAYLGNMGSQQNLSSYSNLPSPRQSQINNLTASTTPQQQAFDIQSLKSKKIVSGLDARMIRFQSQVNSGTDIEGNNQNNQNISENIQSAQQLGLVNMKSQVYSMNNMEGEFDASPNYMKKPEPLWLKGFDIMKCFKIYFPQNNYENVLQKYNQIIQTNIQKKKANTPSNKHQSKASKIKNSYFNIDSPYRKSDKKLNLAKDTSKLNL